MTTTADTIQNLEARIAALRDDLQTKQDALDRLHLDLAKFEESIKPSDPEPLECWARIDENGKPVSLGFNNPAPGSRYVIRFCQVTPEMLQNEKDAARYRKYKELLRNVVNGWDVIPDPYNLDAQLDEAMGKK